MSAPTAKPAAALKSVLALVGAALLYFVSQVLGIDLSGGAPGPGAGAGPGGAPSAPADPVAEEAPPAPSPAPTPAPDRKPTPKVPKGDTAPPATPPSEAPPKPKDPAPVAKRDDTKLIQQLFRSMASDRIVEAEGEVVRVLPTDNEGDRHQVFLLELANGITLKISHNIDLAPELPGLREGDTVRFHGEYEYNEKGGVVHWTHRDPAGRHEHGWLEHGGKRYE